MRRHSRPAGFSLVELITVVLILGILAGVAAPKLFQGSGEAAIEATISHLKTIALAAEICFNETGAWPSDGHPQGMPLEMTGYLRPNLFLVTPPTGEAYDWDHNFGGITAAIKVFTSDPGGNAAIWEAIDRRIDDGNRNTGSVVHTDWALTLIVDP